MVSRRHFIDYFQQFNKIKVELIHQSKYYSVCWLLLPSTISNRQITCLTDTRSKFLEMLNVWREIMLLILEIFSYPYKSFSKIGNFSKFKIWNHHFHTEISPAKHDPVNSWKFSTVKACYWQNIFCVFIKYIFHWAWTDSDNFFKVFFSLQNIFHIQSLSTEHSQRPVLEFDKFGIVRNIFSRGSRKVNGLYSRIGVKQHEIPSKATEFIGILSFS